MIAEIGHLVLIAALMVAFLQSSVPLIGAQSSHTEMMRFGDRAAVMQCALIAVSFALLTVTFLQSDFSVRLAAAHSHSAKPLLYKISGVWGNHEGSILLWVLILAIYGALVPMFGKSLPAPLKARALAVQGMLGFGFLLFVLLTSNPFERLNPVPPDGMGLNPLLQDPGLAVHPPFLYLGYVGFSMSFSFAVAALVEGRVHANWARWLRPWVLLSWSFLTIGITIGSFWAYYELGWGGWWMWDPVENVSFMPWLIGTALLHSIMVLGQRHTLANWTILLAIAAFSLSLTGTFIVRSGVLVSVHAFAVDPARGIAILVLLGIATGGALVLYALRSHKIMKTAAIAPVSRGGALLMNNVLLLTATATVFLGTFYPLFIDIVSGDKITVGAPYFNLTFVPVMFLLIVFMAVGPLLKWRTDDPGRLKGFFSTSAVIIVIVTLTALLTWKNAGGAVGLALSTYLGFAVIKAFRNAPRVTASKQGFVLAHMGLAICAFGISMMAIGQDDSMGRLKTGESITVSGYEFTLDNVMLDREANYEALTGDVSVSKNGRELVSLSTERRFYPVREMFTTEAGFRLAVADTLFAAIGEGNPQDGWIVRAHVHPFVIWIWIGALLMAAAGFVSMTDRRTGPGVEANGT
ncbi:MAG: heme lyase CcmF/NrfE family subunit [Hyphomonadaceae bacterium]|nr:heme lyase CcmF/NrfE family subunit [Hyphomonadaceae bacterium]